MTARRILLVAEAVTLAHYARCTRLAEALQPHGHDVVLASDPRYLQLTPEPRPFRFHPIRSIPSAQFAQALAKGRAVYDAATLTDYAKEDIALLRDVRPDLVIGDFRLSLAVAAPLVGVPYAGVINAYWSPYARIRYPVPDLPFVRLLGVGAGQRLFDIARPLAFALHAMPLNRVRRRFGLAPLPRDLRHCYSWADQVLYPDIPNAIEMAGLPANHQFIGPLLWSARTPLPDWWDALPSHRPVVYVSLGSSGDAKLLPTVLQALGRLPVTVIVTTAGSASVANPPPNAYLADFLPGDLATKRASLMVCNGGNLTAYQAMACAVPVIGIPSNMDQLLNMQMVERLNAGKMLRASELTADRLEDMARSLLAPSSSETARARLATQIASLDLSAKIQEIVEQVLR